MKNEEFLASFCVDVGSCGFFRTRADRGFGTGTSARAFYSMAQSETIGGPGGDKRGHEGFPVKSPSGENSGKRPSVRP